MKLTKRSVHLVYQTLCIRTRFTITSNAYRIKLTHTLASMYYTLLNNKSIVNQIQIKRKFIIL